MDDLVRQALEKWPNVPAVRGWLGLDARGEWFLRDEQVQAAGPFPAVKGSPIAPGPLRDFIGRNYARDDDGGWYFQNGPQRVYVELEAAPWVWRLAPAADGTVAPAVAAHTGAAARVVAGWLDETGRLFLDTDLGLGLVHSLDVAVAAEAFECGAWAEPRTAAFADLPARFGFRRSPAGSSGR